jgi:hypothetical protein
VKHPFHPVTHAAKIAFQPRFMQLLGQTPSCPAADPNALNPAPEYTEITEKAIKRFRAFRVFRGYLHNIGK